MSSDRWIAGWVAAVALLVALAYLPVLNAEYVWDDVQLFVNNPALHLRDLLWPALWEPVLPGTAYLRPVALASFAAQFLTVGPDPGIAHAINLILHVANTGLVGLIAIRLTSAAALPGRPVRVVLACLFYGLHPAQLEAIAWVSGRFDLLVTFFALLGLWGYIALVGWRRDLWVVGYFVLAAFTKEMAVTLPALLFLVYLGRQGPGESLGVMARSFWRRGEWRVYGMLACAGGLVLVVRQLTIGQLAHQDMFVGSELEGAWHHLAFVGQTILFYAKMSLWPFTDLGPHHPFDVASMGVVTRLTGTLAVVASVAFLVFALIRRRWSGLLLAGWGIALVPVLNVVPLTINGSIGSERFLALPLVFLALCISMLYLPAPSLARLRAQFLLGAGFAVLLVAAAFANIRVTLPLWRNELGLWAWAYARNPESVTIQTNYAGAAIGAGDLDRARAVFDRLDAKKDSQLVNMTARQEATLLLVKGEYFYWLNQAERALQSFNEAKALSPTPPHEYLQSQGLGLDDIVSISVNDALFFYRSLYWDYAIAHLKLGNFTDALEAAQISLLYAPTYARGWFVKAMALYGLDRWEEGEDAFAQAEHYYAEDGRQEARTSRADILKKLCGSSTPPALVCTHWRNEANGKSVAHLHRTR